MKYLPSALGVFLLLLAQTLSAAQPSFEDAAPYLTAQTFFLTSGDLSAMDYEKFASEVKIAANTFFPQLMAEPAIQAYVEKFDQWGKDSVEWQKAAMKISDGYMYTTIGQDGVCLILPVKNADPQAEKALINSWNKIQGISNEFTESLTEMGVLKEEDSANIPRFQYTLTRTQDAIVCFSPFKNLQIPNAEAENAPETLEEYLKGAAPRPDFAAGFEKAQKGKVMTAVLALPLPMREAMQASLEDLTPPKEFPLTREQIADLANSAQCIVVATDSLWEIKSVQAVFDSNKVAKNALSSIRTFTLALKKEIRKEAPSPEPALDLINYFLPALTPTQNDSILTFDFSEIQEKISAPVKAIVKEMKEFQADQREKQSVDAKAEADRQYEAMKPWITEGTFLVSRLDLDRVTPSQWFEALQGAAQKFIPLTMNSEPVLSTLDEAIEVIHLSDAILAEQKAKGAKEVYLLADLSNIEAPIRIFLPGVTIKKDADPEKGAVLMAEDIFGDSETLKDLCPLIDSRLVFGQLKDAVVIFPRVDEDTPSDACWESFTSTLNPAENPSIRDGLELNAQCGLSIVLNMNPMLAELVKQGIKEMNSTEKIFSVPSTQFIVDGLNVVALGADPNLGLFEFNVLSKSTKAAKKVMKLLSLWREEIFASIERDPEASKSPILKAYLMDFVDFFISLAVPVRDGNRLYWDLNQNERVKYLKENVPAPMLAASGVGVLAGLLLPAVSQARTAAREMQTGSNYKTLALAMLNYESTFGSYPPAYTVDENGKPLHSWRVLILPFLEQNALYQKIRLDEPWDSEWNSQFHDMCPKVYQSVFNPDPSKAVVGVVVGEKTVFPPVTKKGQRGTRIGEIRDGMSNTILLVPCKPVCWMDPTGDPRMVELHSVSDVEYDGPESTIPVAFCDGSVQRISITLDPETWLAFLTRAGGEAIRRWDF